MGINDRDSIFYDWECPECTEINSLENNSGNQSFKGVVVCRHCGRSFQLEGLKAHGFVYEHS